MGLWERLLGQKDNPRKEKQGEKNISKNIDSNIEKIKSILQDCDDVIYRELQLGLDYETKICIICIDGLCNKNIINDYVLEHLMVNSRMTPPDKIGNKEELINLIRDKNVTITDLKEAESIEEAVDQLLSGETAFLVDGYDKIMIIGSRGWDKRGISQPETEAVVRGPREGFIETLRTNTALIRRKIKDPKLKIKCLQLGRRSKTDVSIMYIEDIVDPECLKEVHRRLETIEIDAILDSGYVEQLIEDNWKTPFPQVQSTERPDVTAAALYEGRIAIVVDNSPFTLIVPTSFNAMMQSAEDYYDRWGVATFIRILRYICVFIALYAPALYISITAFHPQMIPTKLALSIAANRQGVPFPSVVEAIIMELTLEILREAGIRLPGPIGATIGIVGGLVVGQAAVEAGIVGPIMVVVVAVTAISSFSIPRYNLAVGLRLFRFVLIIGAATLGLYGVMFITTMLLIHLCTLKSFGLPYLTPFISFVGKFPDVKDTFIKAPIKFMARRPMSANQDQKIRMRYHRDEDGGEEDQD